MSGAQASPPAVVQLAANPLRWRLLSELARSDLRVRELVTALGAPQPLVSYHLRRLRSGELVSTRPSSFDGRDSYYTLDLERFGSLLAAAGAALHPALAPAGPSRRKPGRKARPPRVLFLCTGNSARSQIAEALVQELSGGAVLAFSAGSRPKSLHPNAVRVMRQRGVDISGRRPKHLDTFRRRRFDCVISLCDRVREVCPEFPGHPETIHWSIPDPAAHVGGVERTYVFFERTAAELESRIRFLLLSLDHASDQEVSGS